MIKEKSIAFVCHPYHRGGVTRWMADAAIAAANDGHTVYFVAPEPSSPFFSAGGRETMLSLLQLYSGQMQLISCNVNFTFEFGTDAYRANIYQELTRKHIPAGVPLILSDDDSVWQGACALADKYPVIAVLHGDQDYYYNKAKKHHRQLSACICVSNRIKRNLIAKCPDIDASKITTIPCGINLPDFNPANETAGMLRLAFIGRLTDYEKRAADLISISAGLQKEYVNFHLHIAGNSDSSAIEFGESFKAQGVGNNVSFHGWQSKSQVQELLNTTDILLLTSNSEGMPLVMMEALASGCGFTGTRVSGIEDFEHDSRAQNCLTVYTVGDIKDAVGKIKQLAAIPVAERQEGARKLAEAEFSMQICLNRYWAAINGIKNASINPSPISLSAKDTVYSKGIALMRFMKVSMMGKKQ